MNTPIFLLQIEKNTCYDIWEEVIWNRFCIFYIESWRFLCFLWVTLYNSTLLITIVICLCSESVSLPLKTNLYQSWLFVGFYTSNVSIFQRFYTGYRFLLRGIENNLLINEDILIWNSIFSKQASEKKTWGIKKQRGGSQFFHKKKYSLKLDLFNKVCMLKKIICFF